MTRDEWFEELPGVLEQLSRRWSLELEPPFGGTEGQGSWVAPARRAGGERIVLKLGFPHFEAEQEIAGLRYWDGDPTVRLIDADEPLNAMLLELCEPGSSLRSAPAEEQDHVIAQLLRRLWRMPGNPHSFRHLADMVSYWCRETREQSARWPDVGLVERGIGLLEELSQPAAGDVLLATDLHAGNVLSAHREPWLVIDPKPFIGDPAYDATQHLFNRGIDAHPRPRELIDPFADLLGVSSERVRLWMFARAAAEPREEWTADSCALARRLRP